MKKIIFAGLLLAPSFVFADVRIHEIAWMGTFTSSSDEWIELYNDGDSPIDVTNWTISISTKKLAGTIPAKGYYLMERTDDTTVPSVTADFIYTGALVDSGVRLVLQNESGTEIDVVDASAGWEKGSSVTKETMQRKGSGWITAEGTPRSGNKTTDTTVTDTTTDTETDKTDTSSPSTTLDTSAHLSPLPLSDFSQKQELSISAGRNRIVSAGTPVFFEAYAQDAKGVKTANISSRWSFGDGAQAGGVKVSHTYTYAGDYVVVLNASAGVNEAVSRASVRVFTPKITLLLEDDGAVSLTNDSPYEINIGGWKIGSFTVSSDTIISSNKKIIFPQNITNLNFSANASIELFAPNGTRVARYEKPKAPINSVATTTAMIIPPVPIEEKREWIAPATISYTEKITPTPKPEVLGASTIIPEKPEPAPVTQKIILKKPEGFFSKIWKFFF